MALGVEFVFRLGLARLIAVAQLVLALDDSATQALGGVFPLVTSTWEKQRTAIAAAAVAERGQADGSTTGAEEEVRVDNKVLADALALQLSAEAKQTIARMSCTPRPLCPPPAQ